MKGGEAKLLQTSVFSVYSSPISSLLLSISASFLPGYLLMSATGSQRLKEMREESGLKEELGTSGTCTL